VVEYVDNRRTERPLLAHETLHFEPVLFDGAVIEH
jgi:hypothetical protein